jgi:hypothetical protein
MVNDNFHQYVDTGVQAMAATLEIAMDYIYLMSEDAIKAWLEETFAFGDEINEIWKDDSLKRRISLYRRTLYKCVGRERMMSLFINIYLSCVGMSTLSGFGMAMVNNDQGRMKKTAKMYINPEKRTIY